jgi:hypothetical protein
VPKNDPTPREFNYVSKNSAPLISQIEINKKVVVIKNHIKSIDKYIDLLRTGDSVEVSVLNYSFNISLYKNYIGFFKQLVNSDRELHPGYDENYLVINLRLGDIFKKNPHKDYNLVPHTFYKKVIHQSGLKPVFMGQTQDNMVIDSLKTNFKEAIFMESINNIYSDFQLLKNSKNKCLAVSSFSYLAGYLGDDDTSIHMPLLGLFNPRQRPDINLIDKTDIRFTYYDDFEVEHWNMSDSQLNNVLTV